MSSSPFELFRRNLKPMMAVLTFLALLSFVVLPAVQTYMQRNPNLGSSNPTVASFGSTELKAAQVEYFTRMHNLTVQALVRMAQTTLDRGGQPQTPGFRTDPRSGQILELGFNDRPSPEGTIRTILFADQARASGFDLDETAISTWLERFTNQELSDSEIMGTLSQATNGQMGRAQFYEQIRSHLLANAFLGRATASVARGQDIYMTPVEQWESFLKLNQSATLDAYGVLVNDYVSEVDANFGDAEVRATYDEGKESLPDENSSDPAFYKPAAAKFEYLVADLETFVDAELANLSDEDIKAEYERRVANGQFQVDTTPAADLLDQMDVVEPESANTSEPAEPAETSSTEGTGEDPTEKTDGSPAPAESKQLSPKQATDEQATNEPAPAEDKPKEPKEEDSSSNFRSERAVVLVSTQDDEAGEEGDLAKTDSPAAEEVVEEKSLAPAQEDKKSESPAKSEETTGDSPPAKKSESAEQIKEVSDSPDATPEETAKPGKDAKSAEMSGSDESSEAPADSDPEPEPEPEVQPLSEVREDLAREMVLPAATSARNDSARSAFKAMRKQSNRIMLAGDSEAVDPLDLKALADELGLKYQITEMLTRFDLPENLQQSYEVIDENARLGLPFDILMFGTPTPQEQFQPKAETQPIQTLNRDTEETFVAWKTEQKDAYIPELDEVRDEVLEYLKLQEAQELAMAEAENIARMAADQNKSLEELIPEDRRDNLLTGLGPVTAINMVGMQQFVTGNVRELDAVGTDFMNALFATPEGGYGVAPNDPRRVFYVVHPTSFSPSIDDLREQFKQPIGRLMARVPGFDLRGIMNDYYESVTDSAGFEENLDQ
ncbi:MAG: hypothetical protein AAF664_07065 [Planctomycetota bacterium]